VVKEAKEVRTAVKKVVKESKDVVDAAKGKNSTSKVTKNSLRSMTKKELITSAKKDFGVDLSNAETKTNLINKVYNLHHKK
jgi:RNA-splicing ligase RtcB